MSHNKKNVFISENASEKIDISKFSEGIYFIKVNETDYSKFQKIK